MSLGMWTLVRMHQQWQFPIPGNIRVSLNVQNKPLTLHFFKVPLQRATAHLHRHIKTIVSDILCHDTLLDQSWIYYNCADPTPFILQEESRKLLTFSSEQRDLHLASHPVNHMHSQCHGQPFLSPVQSQISSNVHMGGGMSFIQEHHQMVNKVQGLKKMWELGTSSKRSASLADSASATTDGGGGPTNGSFSSSFSASLPVQQISIVSIQI